MLYLYALLAGLALGVMTRAFVPGLLLLLAAAGLAAYQLPRGRGQTVEPRNDVELWLFGACANWAQYNSQFELDPQGGYALVRPCTAATPFYLGGRPGPYGSKEDKKYYLHMLDSPWDIHSKKELLETVEYMSVGPGFRKCETQAGRAWELCRCVQLLFIAFRLGWLSREETVRRACQVGKLIQQTFSGWEELSDSFLESALQWMGSEAGMEERRSIHRDLWTRPDSPYNLPWDLPLD